MRRALLLTCSVFAIAACSSSSSRPERPNEPLYREAYQARQSALQSHGQRCPCDNEREQPSPYSRAPSQAHAPPPYRTLPPQRPQSYSDRRPASGWRPREIIVQPGDTLAGICQRYQVSQSSIVSLNRLVDDRVYPGQQLVLPSW